MNSPSDHNQSQVVEDTPSAITLHQPLTGMRVVEMGSSVAGPYAGWVFAQLGAEVLKVEDPRSGDATRHWGVNDTHGHTALFETLNNGKKSIAVDLTDSGDRDALRRLIVASTDIVLQNLRPGFAERCGLGQEALIAAKPDLIYCDLGAYGKGGPLQHLPGYDPLMQGFTGLAQATGTEDSPARVAAPVTDFLTGIWSVVGALSALQTRHQTGKGSAVDVSLMESGIALMTMFVGLFQSTNARPQRNGLQGPLVAPNGGFMAQDGLVMIVCGTDHLFLKLCAAIDRPELGVDPRFASATARYAGRAALQTEIESELKKHTREHWMTKIGDGGVPIAPVNHVDEMMAHPQARAVGMLQSLDTDDGTHSEFETARLPIRLNGERAGYTHRAPHLGEHTAALLDPFKTGPDA
jgi:crotonobetainyl-CoA:carnitine CoA-transferase CaiB-like acyl-CoA transferase